MKNINKKNISCGVNQVVTHENDYIDAGLKKAWSSISPWWPLKNLVAANPLQGFENLTFEKAFSHAQYYFQNIHIQKKMSDVNRQTIKWCQVFFDEGQATIGMPNRNKGLYLAWRELIFFDAGIHRNHQQSMDWLAALPLTLEDAMRACLKKLDIKQCEYSVFFTLLLTTLPGWSGYIKYHTDWAQIEADHKYRLDQKEFLTIRMIITCLMYPSVKELIDVQAKMTELTDSVTLKTMAKQEVRYKKLLVGSLNQHYSAHGSEKAAEAQLVFCIDVRSETFRRAIESQGNYETLGFAGFFGIPVTIENSLTGESYASCPVLLSPKQKITLNSSFSHCNADSVIFPSLINDCKKIYQGLKYTFATPFVLAEGLGIWSGLWMMLRTLFPRIASKISRSMEVKTSDHLDLDEEIEIKEQCQYAEGALRMMGLTSQFAPLVVLCGHGSATQNNTYASALDCGACGGHDGAANAKILAKILNNPMVRAHLNTKDIKIPDTTIFLPALHNTTTDEVTIFSHLASDNPAVKILQNDLAKARSSACKARISALSRRKTAMATQKISRRSIDWSETRPEWGLARNAAFIIAPRSLTKHINLKGRSFLHSYDWQQDTDGRSLTVILTAPMIVAQWISCQYLFSTIDNIAYGSGSKITHNITGKIGVMQGNASDLMHGLPLQSVKSSDRENYHEPLRLLTVVHAPKKMIESIIVKHEVLKKLFGNGWVNLTCIDPDEGGSAYDLQRNFTWIPSLFADEI